MEEDVGESAEQLTKNIVQDGVVVVTAVIDNLHTILDLSGDALCLQLDLSNQELVHHPSVPGWYGVGEEGLAKDQVKENERFGLSVTSCIQLSRYVVFLIPVMSMLL